MDQVIREFIREMKLSQGLNTQRVYAAWDAVSGVSRYTVGRNFSKGVLYVTLSSSVVRNQLYFQIGTITKKLNEALQEDPLFTPPEKDKGPFVKSVVLR